MIPLSTTTISVQRSSQDGTQDPRGDTITYTTIASGVRAHISSPGGSETLAIGSMTTKTFRLDCDPTDIRHDDRIADAQGTTYEVSWAAQRVGLGLDHTVADLQLVEDQV